MTLLVSTWAPGGFCALFMQQLRIDVALTNMRAFPGECIFNASVQTAARLQIDSAKIYSL